MSTPDDGGPAFPVARVKLDGREWVDDPGMSLLDWFAGQALVISVGRDLDAESMPTPFEETAMNAYDIAEAMLAEKKKRT